MMNSQEQFNFFATQLTAIAKGLEVAKSTNDALLAALNFGEMFKAHLMCGLIKWRLREDPTRHLQDAVLSVNQAVATSQDLFPSFNIKREYWISVASLLASLIDMPFILTQLEVPEDPVDVRLDCLLARTAPSVNAKSKANILIGKLRSKTRTLLSAETYENYFDILSSKEDCGRVAELLERGEVLYTKREHNAFFSGGPQTEGGGPDNAFVVDYRLGFVLKKIQYNCDSVHAWIW